MTKWYIRVYNFNSTLISEEAFTDYNVALAAFSQLPKTSHGAASARAKLQSASGITMKMDFIV